MSRVGVVTINYNNFSGLKKTLDSIFNQNCKLSHFVYVDGCSSDGSNELLSSYDFSEVAEKVTVVIEKDDGLYDAMNKGLGLIDCDYVVFMNSGDSFFDCDVIANISSFEPEFFDFIYGDYAEVGKSQTFLKKSRNLNWLSKGMITSHQAMYFSKKVIEEFDVVYDMKYEYASDYDFVCKFIKVVDSKRVFRIEEPLCFFDNSGISNTQRIPALKENYKIRREILDMDLFSAIFLYVIHYAHTVAKSYFPGFTKKIRGMKKL